MVFAAQKLHMTPELKNPTVVIVDDRIDLETQITATFNASDVPNLQSTSSREELIAFFKGDMRKVLTNHDNLQIRRGRAILLTCTILPAQYRPDCSVDQVENKIRDAQPHRRRRSFEFFRNGGKTDGQKGDNPYVENIHHSRQSHNKLG